MRYLITRKLEAVLVGDFDTLNSVVNDLIEELQSEENLNNCEQVLLEELIRISKLIWQIKLDRQIIPQEIFLNLQADVIQALQDYIRCTDLMGYTD